MLTKWRRAATEAARRRHDRRSEVQIAVATERIAHKVKHLQSPKKDHNSNRHLMMLVHQRNRMLLYLRRKDRAKYHEVIAGLGLRPSQSFDPTLKVRHSTWKKGKPPKKAKKKSNKRKALKPWLRSYLFFVIACRRAARARSWSPRSATTAIETAGIAEQVVGEQPAVQREEAVASRHQLDDRVDHAVVRRRITLMS